MSFERESVWIHRGEHFAEIEIRPQQAHAPRQFQARGRREQQQRGGRKAAVARRLGSRRAAAEIRHQTSSKRKLSAARPGPNASAMASSQARCTRPMPS